MVIPPASRHSFMPRLYDATRVPSVVASGTKYSPCACSPLTNTGPASPIGTCATPKKFSMLPGSVPGSSEYDATCSTGAPVCSRTNSCRALIGAGP